jgi:SAM-dependent methyltransferase
VDAALALAPGTAVGFALDCSVPAILRNRPGLVVTVEAVARDGRREVIGTRNLRYSIHDYRTSALGYILEPGYESIVRREFLYGSGPPSPVASPECADLIFRYIRAGDRVLDVGCGIGAYGRVFRERGQPWTGCEVQADFVETARADGLDAHLMTNGKLPFPDGAFDAAIAIEVIEHVDDLAPLLSEMARVAPRMALFSVPNIETLPVTGAFYALPWHMLESTHVNFFTHASLAAALRPYYSEVEVYEYGQLVLLKSEDGLPLNNHLFATARREQ